MPEPQPDALWAAWLTLDDTERRAMDTAFRDIAALSGEKGCRAILDDAAWYFATDPAAHTAFVEQLASLANHGERAMTTFLDHPACWRGATRFYQAEVLPFWRKRNHLPRVPAAVDEASLQALAAGISTYFHHAEGRGTRCVVEPVRRGALDYFFAYPEDYSQHSIEWVDGQFGQRPHHPAFEVVYVYSQSDGSLDLNVRGARTAVQPLEGLFAATILKQPELPPPRPDRRPGLRPESVAGARVRVCLRQWERHSERRGDGVAPRVEGDDGRPPHARSRCDWPPHGGLRPACAAGLGGGAPPLPRHPGRVGGVSDHGDQQAAHACDDSPLPSQCLLAALRRPRPDPARHAARLRDRAKSARRRGAASGMTPREALLDLVGRVGARDGAAVRISETDLR